MSNPFNQKGFATTETVLVVIIAAMLAGTGYFVYHSNKKASDTYASASKAAAASQPVKAVKKAASSAAGPASPVVDTGAPGPVYDLVLLATTPEQKEQAKTIAVRCFDDMRKTDKSAKSASIVAVTRAADLFNGPSPAYLPSPIAVTMNASCYNKAVSRAKQTASTLRYILKKDSTKWTIISVGQLAPRCDQVDGKPAVRALSPVCYDPDGTSRQAR